MMLCFRLRHVLGRHSRGGAAIIVQSTCAIINIYHASHSLSRCLHNHLCKFFKP